MMEDIKLSVDLREVSGKKVAAVRKAGLVPGVVYGGKSKPVIVQSDYNATEKVVRDAGFHLPVRLTVDGKKRLVVIKNVDIDPVTRRLINIEYNAIKANEPIVADVPIEMVGVGESEAEKASLALAQVLEHIEVKALPADMPAAVEIDVTGLETVEDKLSLEDIKLPEGVEYADPEVEMNQTVVNVFDPAVEAAKQEAAEEAAAAEADAAGGETLDEAAADEAAEEASADGEAKPEEKAE
jgi:large subunit ribosomal protein L25